MIILHAFGAKFGLPEASPFTMKADILLKMSGLDYVVKTDGDVTKAPKEKFPIIDDNGTIVTDSTFIRFHLENKHAIDFNHNVSAARQAALWGLERTAENESYFIAMESRWLDDDNFAKGPATFFEAVPAPLRPLICAIIRRKIKKTLWLQGLGRHTEAEKQELIRRWIWACAKTLDAHDYFGGTAPCAADATLFSFLIGIDCPFFDTPYNGMVAEHPALTLYCERMMQRFYGETTHDEQAA